MQSQTLALSIALISLISSLVVVLITAASNAWAKQVDAEQKKEDRNQDLRKLYLTRKLEAGEKMIARRVKLITNTEFNIQHYRRFANDAAYFNRNCKEVLEESKAFAKADRVEASAYLLYFASEETSSGQEIANRLNDIKQKLLAYLQERSRILSSDVEKAEAAGIDLESQYYEKHQEIEKLIPEFIEVSQQLKEFTIKSCNEIRNDLRKYDLH